MRKSRTRRGGKRKTKRGGRSKRRTRRGGKRSRRLRLKGGSINFPLVPKAFPPNGPVNVPVPGTPHNLAYGGKQNFYYEQNKKVIGAPATTNRALGGGGKRKSKKGGRRKLTKGGRRKKKGGRRRKTRQRGGASVAESVPLGTDARDVWFGGTNALRSFWNTWNGFGPGGGPPPYTAQPIARAKTTTVTPQPIYNMVKDGSNFAAGKAFRAYN